MTQRRIGIVLSYANLLAKNIVNILYTPILLRMLGQSDYGLYQMANSVIGSLTLLNLGFGSAYIRFYARANNNENKEEKVAELNGLYLGLFTFLSIISILAGFLLIFNINTIFSRSLSTSEIHTMKILMILMIFNIAISFPSSVFDSNIIANEQFRFQRSRQLFQTIATPILTLPLLFIGLKSISIVLVQTLVTLLFFYLNVRFAMKNLKMRFKFTNMDYSLLKEIGTFSFFIFLNQIIDQINWNLPNFLLGILAGSKQVAVFAVANQIKNIFISLSTSLSGVFVPEINKIVNTTDDNKKLTHIMTKVGRLQMIILTFILGGFILLGRFFIKVWAGQGYDDAYIIALLLTLPFIVTLIQNTGYEIVRAKNMHQFRATVEFIFALVNVALTYYFIQKFGVIGSAMGTVITMVIVSWFIMNWFYHYKVGLNMRYFWSKILIILPPVIVPLIILTIAQYFWSINSIPMFFIYGVAFTMLYFIIFYFFTADNYEKTILQNLLFKYIKRGKKSQ